MAPGAGPVVFEGEVDPTEAGTYLLLGFDVDARTRRLELSYSWQPRVEGVVEPVTARTVIDLGLWDEGGPRDARGFRGWSGCRHRHVWVEAGSAQRGYRPGPIGAGRWHAELGFASVGPAGARWTVEVRATEAEHPGSLPPESDPVDATHVASPGEGWYHGDLHIHSWHSHPEAADAEGTVARARQAGLDFVPITEYVVGHHWDSAGPLQRAHPDLVIWPGREIVTYRGHVQSLGETPGFIEYRYGFADVRLATIQAEVLARGALFGVNHPTAYAGEALSGLCRGCAFELGDEVDWASVDTIEVLTGPMLVDPREYGFAGLGRRIPNPFCASAIALWESLLTQGHHICAVSGSDDKLGRDLGCSATAVRARELSRPALMEAIRAGRAYVKTLGVEGSPHLEISVTGPRGQRGGLGDTLVLGPGEEAEIELVVARAAGQRLRAVANGATALEVVLAGEVQTVTVRADRRPDSEGPLGTWWRFETADEHCLTTITNPIFLAGP